jgi:hypothetical protein
MKLYVIVILVLGVSSAAAQENKPDIERKYHPDSLRAWTKSILHDISDKHPGFYRYTPKTRFDFLIDSTNLTITDSLSVLQYYRKLKPLFASIGCVHTGVALPEEFKEYLQRSRTLIPFDVFIDSSYRVFISESYSPTQPDLSGAEILSINGRSIEAVLRTLLNAIPSDGYNMTEKVLLLNHRFPFWYQTIIEATNNFSVEFDIKSERNVRRFDGVSGDVFPTDLFLERNYAKTLEFGISDGTAILKVHAFAKSAMKRHNQNFKRFIRSSFKTLKNSNVNNLVIDLRYNTGGTDGNAAFLSSYFFDTPFRYWSRIDVTEATAKEIKGVFRFFYKRPKLNNGSYQWKKCWVTSEFDYYDIQKPAKNFFTGNVYVITNGLCLSSCADFVAVLSHNKKALVVGQETGGGFQGNNSGMMPEATIPTGLVVTVPLQRYTTAVDADMNFGRGTIPDLTVTVSFDDWISKRDVEMDAVWSLIRHEKE